MPGNFHKSGLTFSILKKMLNESGFTKIRKKKSQSFLSESGLRLESVKSSKKINLIASIRINIMKEFPPPNVELYAAIESNIIDRLQTAQDESISHLIVDFCIFNPSVARIVYKLLPKSKSEKINSKIVDFLIQNNFLSRLYLNWELWSKSTQNLGLELNRFRSYWKDRILKINGRKTA